MLFMVCLGIVTLVLLVAAQDNIRDFSAREDKSLAKSLRRQLMIDNYDYSHEQENSTEKENSNNKRREKKTRKNFYVSDLAINNKEDVERNFHSKLNDNVKNNTKKVEHVVSEKDLLYYIDDENIATKKSVKIESTARYKLLKQVRRQYRRSGQAHLIQEENKDGVAIVNLYKGPFPELRLPNSRRQYMHDHGEAMADEEEVPPPAVNTSEPEAAPGEVGIITETELVNVLTTKN